MHYYEELIENVYNDHEQLNLLEQLTKSLVSIGFTEQVIKILVKNSIFTKWPKKILSLSGLDLPDYQKYKDENVKNLKQINCEQIF
jgi:hypothetical protein